MGLLNTNVTQRDYYQGNDFGTYQFTSLEHIINQFITAYVGEDKIISKARRTDVQFHAMRALQELSFDVFKSTKAHEIEVPSSLKMMLPQDYVNYVSLSWSDGSGIEHRIYPTNKTSNPFEIKQEDDGSYEFAPEYELLQNADFSSPLSSSGPWSKNSLSTSELALGNSIAVSSGELVFTSNVDSGWSMYFGRAYSVWQPMDVTGIDFVTISAKGTSADASGTIPAGILRMGLSTTPGHACTAPPSTPTTCPSENVNPPDIDYLEWNNGEGPTTKTKYDIDVRNHQGIIYLLITSFVENIDVTAGASENKIDDISALNSSSPDELQRATSNESTTWNNYKSATPSENQDDYQDDTYWPANGQRYGLDPQHAQTNGSFYIDNIKGLINFSSNISGKTVILKYISDSLGTDAEMQVHKFAEEAMYKWIAHAILATRANIPEYQVNRFKKERFAAIRQAKLRLSNIKLEEITQVLRGKSKQIKH